MQIMPIEQFNSERTIWNIHTINKKNNLHIFTAQRLHPF